MLTARLINTHLNIALFSTKANNPRIDAHCKRGGIAIHEEAFDKVGFARPGFIHIEKENRRMRKTF
ncbi:hypothetical protein Loa_00292 [Legionella oakridgensis ATCC 33761 = DSM 21215]|uniref:Uncharacterized protein n=2 Tax=Legionella oakridgensis TaxID=29423 RepID=W0BB19_9GAMM|nr:hypothetical protein Loa_00292 [Legionella oakridgensis ATCC 33761 = DSM 21215]ETO94336.1 hypothetical protein LOR_96c25430 [Legionella oakridgensis RV-2-2007]KTD39040.1 hypothetical protein Loak_1161 [Legionella oakridgensis]STY15814.1 Uncharacterised protein [Legionella longbeachae]